MRKTTEKEKRKTRWKSNDMHAHEEIKIATTNVDREWTRGSKGIGSVKKERKVYRNRLRSEKNKKFVGRLHCKKSFVGFCCMCTDDAIAKSKLDVTYSFVQ